MNILIVDDSPDQRVLLETILRQAGHGLVRLAGSAQEAYQELGMDNGNRAGPEPDLILLDIMMPGINGVEACRTIKTCPSISEVPVIMVTAKTDTSYLQDAFAAGAIDFLTKPVNKVELTARVASALTLKREMDRRKARETGLYGLTGRSSTTRSAFSFLLSRLRVRPACTRFAMSLGNG